SERCAIYHLFYKFVEVSRRAAAFALVPDAENKLATARWLPETTQPAPRPPAPARYHFPIE
ncbi:jg25049, partial [Pararge aegeria aegeria]